MKFLEADPREERGCSLIPFPPYTFKYFPISHFSSSMYVLFSMIKNLREASDTLAFNLGCTFLTLLKFKRAYHDLIIAADSCSN